MLLKQLAVTVTRSSTLLIMNNFAEWFEKDDIYYMLDRGSRLD